MIVQAEGAGLYFSMTGVVIEWLGNDLQTQRSNIANANAGYPRALFKTPAD
ncbi:MAG: hypothetical protein HYX68_25880 [Planctomycetes bacterium]|nr:hypothetical protein [Planctomycetota bacterium]